VNVTLALQSIQEILIDLHLRNHPQHHPKIHSVQLITSISTKLVGTWSNALDNHLPEMHVEKQIIAEPVFCCGSAAPVHTSQNNKLYHNLDRNLHDDIFRSFLDFALRRQDKFEFDSTALKLEPKPNIPIPPTRAPFPEPWVPGPILTPEALANNPITPDTLYCIHVTSRHDFGQVYSHRYYAMPKSLKDDWVEINKIHWFAEGYPFRMTTDKWDSKCKDDPTFFRMELRPNLGLRRRMELNFEDVTVKDVAI
jgi:hypothetical protein